MFNLKNNAKILCSLFILTFTTATAAPSLESFSPNTQHIDMRYYVRDRVAVDSFSVVDGKMYYNDGSSLVLVNSIFQDENGMRVFIYGLCPNGHAYDKEGGCWGIGCPCSEPPF